MTITKNTPKNIDVIFLIALLFAIVFIPFIPITSSFNLAVEEVLLLYPALRLLTIKPKINTFSIVLATFSVYILFTIFMNGHMRQLNEYFEVFKIIKLIIVYQFSVFVLSDQKHLNQLVKAVNVIFILSFVINFIHFFDFFNFTRSCLSFYDPNSIDVATYGLNSLGQPAAKRIIGTFGNPNDNAIFFLFLVAFYATKINYLKDKLYSFHALSLIGSSMMVILTQSRTGFIVLIALFILHLYNNRIHYKKVLLVLLSIAAIFFVNYNIDAVATSYFHNTSARIIENNSVKGRIEVWKHLLQMWNDKPIFGYGPNKNYMYANNIYPENEYIFFLWRFGLVGLLFYLYLIFYPIVALKRKIGDYSMVQYAIIIIAITALTNVPLSNMKFMFFVAIIYGSMEALKERKSLQSIDKC